MELSSPHRARHALPTGRRANVISTLPLREFVAFLAFGGVAALANLLAGWVLYGAGLFPWLPYSFATAFAAAAGVIVNFGLNYTLNFRFRGRSAFQQFRTFCVVAGVGIALTSWSSSVLLIVVDSVFPNGLQIAAINVSTPFAAHFSAVALVAFYSFPAHRSFSFNTGIRARLRNLGLWTVEVK